MACRYLPCQIIQVTAAVNNSYFIVVHCQATFLQCDYAKRTRYRLLLPAMPPDQLDELTATAVFSPHASFCFGHANQALFFF